MNTLNRFFKDFYNDTTHALINELQTISYLDNQDSLWHC